MNTKTGLKLPRSGLFWWTLGEHSGVGSGLPHPMAALHQGAGRSTTLAPALAQTLPIALLCFGNSVNRK